MSKTQIKLSEIKRLIQEEGYYRFTRECKESDDKSIQDHYDLKTWEVTELNSHPSLTGIRRNVKIRSFVLIDDTDSNTEAVKEEKEVIEIIEEAFDESIVSSETLLDEEGPFESPEINDTVEAESEYSEPEANTVPEKKTWDINF
jgi:hypothetical protein